MYKENRFIYIGDLFENTNGVSQCFVRGGGEGARRSINCSGADVDVLLVSDGKRESLLINFHGHKDLARRRDPSLERERRERARKRK